MDDAGFELEGNSDVVAAKNDAVVVAVVVVVERQRPPKRPDGVEEVEPAELPNTPEVDVGKRLVSLEVFRPRRLKSPIGSDCGLDRDCANLGPAAVAAAKMQHGVATWESNILGVHKIDTKLQA